MSATSATYVTRGGRTEPSSRAGTLNREDWGIGWNVVLESGGLLVSREVRIEIEVETVRQR
jgi:polyisoprenoid-binding protein YceI